LRTVILGASLAGVSTAISLLSSKPEAEVTLIDRKLKGRPSRCAGGVSTYMLGKTGLEEVPSRLVQAGIRSVRIYGPDLKTYWGFETREAYGYVLDRPRLEEWLIAGAERLGARLVEWNVPSVCALWGRFRYDYLVGADGLTSTVRDYLGLPCPKPNDIHLGLQYEADWDDYPQGEVRLYFSERLAPQGYAWVFPAGKGSVKVGLGIPLSASVNPGTLLEKFREAVDAPPIKGMIAKLIPTAPPMESCVYGNVALVGDAGLQCDPLTGGGIANALICGGLLGQALASERLSLYDPWWRRAVGRRNLLRYRLKHLLHSLDEGQLTRLVEALQGFKPRSPSVGKELARAIVHVLLRGGLGHNLKTSISLLWSS